MSLPNALLKVLIVALILVAPSTATGQGIPWYTIPLPVPNGFVNAATGDVHLEIPLGVTPQRNDDPFIAKLIYDSPHNFFNYNTSAFSGGPGWRAFVGTTRHSGTGFMASNTSQSCPPGWNGNVYYVSVPSFTDGHGTTHSNSNQGLYTRRYDCSANGTPYGTRDDITSFFAVADDGSGYKFQVSNYTNLTVTSPDDWLVYDNTGTNGFNWPKDTNGNYIQSAVVGQPDTLGRSPFQISYSQCPATNGTTITVRASDGSTNTYTFTCTSYSVSQIVNGTTQYTGTRSFLTSIGLPDGTQYSFIYDTGTTGNHLGDLLSVTLPTGGLISFGLASVNSVPPSGPLYYPTFRVGSATFAGGTWTLSYSYNTSAGVTTTTVMSPSRYDSVSKTNVSDQTVFTSVPFNPYIQTAQYYSGSATLLRSVVTGYSNDGNFLPMTVTTTLNDTGQSSSVSYQYYNSMRDYPTQKQETDFTGSVVRTTVTSYYGLMKPKSVNVYAGSNTSGTPISSTLYFIDEYSANYCKNGVPGLTGITGATGHDDNYGTSFLGRGNVTTIQRLISGTTYSTTHACYDTLGNVTQTVDANGNPTTYNYADSGKWADTACIPSGTNTYAFPTTITDALGFQKKYTYFTCTSLKQSQRDQNDINASRSGTTYTYDLYNRPLVTTFPDGGQTTYCYSHDPNLPCYTSALPPFETESKLMSGGSTSTSLTTKTLLDAYARVVETQLTSDPDCASGDKTDTTYDSFGRVASVSNPYCTTGDSTYGLTTYANDALGRTTQVTHPDNSTSLTTYTGRATQVQDEGNGNGTQRVTRISQADGLGRLTSVCEVAPGPFVGAGGASSSSLIGSGGTGTPASCGLDIAGTGFLTTYQYDVLDNLLQVNQSGLAARSFNYDSLSRLTSATNPESGTICYGTYSAGVCQGNGYDANGNLTTKTAPAPNQSSTATVTASYQYDALNRLTQKSYNDTPRTPTATFTYDQGGSGYTNLVGRLYESAVGTSNYTLNSYDPMGRIISQFQAVPAANNNAYGYTLPYTYDLMGNMTFGGNGCCGAGLTYTHNAAARLTGLSYVGTTYLSGAHYDAAGRITSDTLGDNEVESWTYNKRGWPVSSTSTYNSTTTYSYSITSFAPNGDILAANDSANGNWNYSYDQFNRLVCATTTGTCATPPTGTPSYTYVYDRFGNRWQQNGSRSFIASFTGNNTTNNNRMDSYSYDAAGNLLNDGTHQYFYDAENRLIQVDGSSGYCSSGTGTTATACYFYDASGHRVRSTAYGICGSAAGLSGGIGYVYDLSGHMIVKVPTIYPGGGVNCGFEIYAGSRHLVYSTAGDKFSHVDWLGTERVHTETGSVCESIASLPFGDGQTITGGCYHDSTLHFTGKERDTETGLDYFGARFDASSFGRFLSPDPAGNSVADASFPQSWNLYSYVMNKPLNFTDPYGLDCAYLNDSGTAAESIDHYSNIGECEQNGGYWANGTINQLSWVQPNVDSDTAVIYSQFDNGGIGVSLASQTWTQGAFGLPDDATQSMTSFQEWTPMTTEQQRLLTLKLAGLEAEHAMGCVAIPGAGLLAGGTAFQLGQPTRTKSFSLEGSSKGTSPASEALRDAFPQTVEKGIPTPVGGPGTGSPFRISPTTSVGGAAARYLPFVGAAVAGYSAYKTNQCLNQKP